jgi:hypothetical protein
MADRYTGEDVAITFDAGTGHFQSIDIHIFKSKWNAPSSDSDVEQRGSGRMDADITLKGWDSEGTGGLTFADLGNLVLSGAAPSAFTWTDKAETPVSRLPTDFFTKFPLAKMRVDDVSGGSADANKPSEWTAKISVNNID